jgi:hypothetical protein
VDEIVELNEVKTRTLIRKHWNAPADIKVLHAEDFEAWRSHLRSFIPEKDAQTNKRVYISANNGKDLEAVDLSHLFTSSRTVGSIIKAIKDQVKQMEKDKVDQPGLMSMVLPKGEFSVA